MYLPNGRKDVISKKGQGMKPMQIDRDRLFDVK